MKKQDPSPAAVALWLKQQNREQLHGQGWIIINKRFHGIARAARSFLIEEFPDEKERQAAFDGLTLGLWAMGHFEDVEKLTALLGKPAPKELPASKSKHLTQPDNTPETN